MNNSNSQSSKMFRTILRVFFAESAGSQFSEKVKHHIYVHKYIFFYEWLQLRNASRNSRKQRNSQLSRSTSTGNHLVSVHLLIIKLSLLIFFASFLDWSVSIDTTLSTCITFCYHFCVTIVGRVIHVHVAIQEWINLHNYN